jgi:hypothetical protein
MLNAGTLSVNNRHLRHVRERSSVEGWETRQLRIRAIGIQVLEHRALRCNRQARSRNVLVHLCQVFVHARVLPPDGRRALWENSHFWHFLRYGSRVV